MLPSSSRILAISLLVFLASTCQGDVSAEQTATEYYSKIPPAVLAAAQAVVAVILPDERCTGFMMSGHSIATAYHCARALESTEIRIEDAKFGYAPTLSQGSRVLDLAVVKVPEQQHPPRMWIALEVSKAAELNPGDEVYLVGKRTGIHRLKITRAPRGAPFVEATAGSAEEKTCEPGDSGGPILDRDGNVVAVLTGHGGELVRPSVCTGVTGIFLGRLIRGEEIPVEFPPIGDESPAGLLYADHAAGLGDFDYALRYADWITTKTKNATAQHYRIICKSKTYIKDENKVLRACEKANEFDPADADTLNAISVIYFERRDFVHALDFITRAEKAAPNTPMLAVGVGATLLELGRTQEAERKMKEVIATADLEDVSLIDAYGYLIDIANARGDFKKSWQWVHRAHRNGVALRNEREGLRQLREKMPEPTDDGG